MTAASNGGLRKEESSLDKRDILQRDVEVIEMLNMDERSLRTFHECIRSHLSSQPQGQSVMFRGKSEKIAAFFNQS